MFACGECNYKAISIGMIKIHYNSKHKGCRVISKICCDNKCRKEGANKHNRGKHERKICLCMDMDSLDEQNRKVNKGVRVKHSCRMCDYQAMSNSNLNQHIKSVRHTPSMVKNTRFTMVRCKKFLKYYSV